MVRLEDLQIKNLWSSFNEYRRNKQKGIPTGLKCLDFYIKGLHGTTTIQGGTGCNKSTLALQIALNHSKKTGPVLFFDRENGINRLLERLTCQILNCYPEQIQNDEINIDEAIEILSKRRFFVFNEASLEALDDLIGQCRELWPDRPTLLVVDSLQCLPPIHEKENMSIGLWMVGLDDLKLKYDPNLVMIVTSEKTKSGYESTSEVAGYGSNKVGYKSEIVLDLALNKETNHIACTISKDRDGPANVLIHLQKKMIDPSNLRSFCFKLEAAEAFI